MQLLKQVIMSFLCLSVQIFSMENVSLDPLAQRIKLSEKYYQAVRKINIKNEKKLKAFCREYGFIANSSDRIKLIEQQLEQVRQKLVNRKEQIFLDYKNDNNISDKEWSIYRGVTQRLNVYVEQNNNDFVFSHITHDSHIPIYLVLMLKKCLIRNSVNPEKINLLSTKDYDFAAGCFLIDYEDFRRSINIVGPGCIDVNINVVEKLSLDAQEGLCSLMAYLVKADYAYCAYGALNLDTPIEYCSLSLLTLALKNEYNNAQLLKTLCTELYNSQFSIDDYKQLNEICRLHKILTWLQEYAVPL